MKTSEMEDVCLYVPTTKVRENPAAIYKQHESQQMDSLRLLLKIYGVKNPLRVKQKDDTYILIDGHRRLKLAAELGIEKVPVVVHEYAGEADEVKDMLLLNRTRVRTSRDIVDEYHAWRRVIPSQQGKRGQKVAAGPSSDRIADLVGVHGKTLQRLVMISKNDASLLDLIDNRTLSVYSAAILAKLLKQGKIENRDKVTLMVSVINLADPALLDSFSNKEAALEEAFKEALSTIRRRTSGSTKHEIAVHTTQLEVGKDQQEPVAAQEATVNTSCASEGEQSRKSAAPEELHVTPPSSAMIVHECCGDSKCKFFGKRIMVVEGGEA